MTDDIRTTGFFRIRQAKGGRMVGLRVWFGAPPDPDNPGETLDRSPRWQWQINGGEIHTMSAGDDAALKERAIWSSREPIDRREYDYLLSSVEWDTDAGQGPGAKETVDFGKLKHDF